MCSMPECTEPVTERIVPSIPGAKKRQVGVVMCPRCDTRQCPKCGKNVLHPKTHQCPNCRATV